MKRLILSAIILFGLILTQTISANEALNCYGIVVGKDASTSGKVIMGHNEDDSGPQVVNHHKIPRIIHKPGEKVTLLNGGELDQADTTWAYIWSEMPGMRFSDAYVNEWGVVIASDACRSCEDKPELTNGGISYMLRRLVAERSMSSREGVHLAGKLVERFGYDGSGRTYLITDPNEGWLFCAVNGKHWLAARVPDDEVAIIANTYTVREVDLSDTVNFLAADDIIQYAIDRGWHDPETDGKFDFARVFSNPSIAADSANFCRQWGGLRHFVADSIPMEADLPFSVKPKAKSNIFSVMMILRDHYEDTELYAADSVTGCPHQIGVRSICTETTRNSVVIQYGGPNIYGYGKAIYWVSLGRPCTSPFIPFFIDMHNFPPAYATRHDEPSEDLVDQMISSDFIPDQNEAYWTFRNYDETACRSYTDRRKTFMMIEDKSLKDQRLPTRHASNLYQNMIGGKPGSLEQYKRQVADTMTNYSSEVYQSALEMMEKYSKKFK